MEIGEVGFKDQHKVNYVSNVIKNNEILKRLKKNTIEKKFIMLLRNKVII